MSIATVNMREMVKFYNTVFDASLIPHQFGNHIVYRGSLDGMDITLTPNDLLNIRKERNPVQFSFVVSNLDEALARVERSGGRQVQEIIKEYSERYCGIIDPDGNTIELVEQHSVNILIN